MPPAATCVLWRSIMMPHTPAGMTDIADQLTKSIITGEEASG